MSDDEKWVWVGFDDDTNHSYFQSFDLDALVYRTKLNQKTIKLGEVPAKIKNRVEWWPKFEPFWAYLHNVGYYLFSIFYCSTSGAKENGEVIAGSQEL
jgi:hypothetical protein